MEHKILMKAILSEKMKWESELSITDPTDPYANRCRQEVANSEMKIKIAEANAKKSSKKATKKSK